MLCIECKFEHKINAKLFHCQISSVSVGFYRVKKQADQDGEDYYCSHAKPKSEEVECIGARETC
jgi:hypothetical protein